MGKGRDKVDGNKDGSIDKDGAGELLLKDSSYGRHGVFSEELIK